ncbi:MAG: hypothetical protein M3R61_00065 [Chloroflexota bacterium]|nr:hypothetical protein [Chloroflexota bacterium]
MPDSTNPATGPLIMEQVIQIAATMQALTQLLETHTGAAADHRKAELQAIEDLRKDTAYYGDQLIRAYHNLNARVRVLTEQIDARGHTERELAAHLEAA